MSNGNDTAKKKSLLRMMIPSKETLSARSYARSYFLSPQLRFWARSFIWGYITERRLMRMLSIRSCVRSTSPETTMVIAEATYRYRGSDQTAPPEGFSSRNTVTGGTTTTTPPPPLVISDEMAGFVAKNPDTAGWITIKGTAVDNVVVQAADNDYYLKRDFYGGRSYAGTLYVDFRCVLNDYDFNQSDNIVIYGHNQKNGAMFGTLQYYKVTKNNTSRFDFYKQHPTFTFSNLYKTYTYKIIAFFITESSADESPDGKIFDVHNYVKFTKGRRSLKTLKKEIFIRIPLCSRVLISIRMTNT